MEKYRGVDITINKYNDIFIYKIEGDYNIEYDGWVNYLGYYRLTSGLYMAKEFKSKKEALHHAKRLIDELSMNSDADIIRKNSVHQVEIDPIGKEKIAGLEELLAIIFNEVEDDSSTKDRLSEMPKFEPMFIVASGGDSAGKCAVKNSSKINAFKNIDISLKYDEDMSRAFGSESDLMYFHVYNGPSYSRMERLQNLSFEFDYIKNTHTGYGLKISPFDL